MIVGYSAFSIVLRARVLCTTPSPYQCPISLCVRNIRRRGQPQRRRRRRRHRLSTDRSLALTVRPPVFILFFFFPPVTISRPCACARCVCVVFTDGAYYVWRRRRQLINFGSIYSPSALARRRRSFFLRFGFLFSPKRVPYTHARRNKKKKCSTTNTLDTSWVSVDRFCNRDGPPPHTIVILIVIRLHLLFCIFDSTPAYNNRSNII